MADEPLIFGLAAHHYAELCAIFRDYPQIEQVLIFGSRARATGKPGSDFDLALVAPAMSDRDFTALWNAIDDLPLVFKFDVLHFDRLEPGPLKERITTQGRPFYPQR